MSTVIVDKLLLNYPHQTNYYTQEIVDKIRTCVAKMSTVIVDKLLLKLSTIMFAYYTQVIVDVNGNILSTVLWMSGKSTYMWSYCGRFVHNIYLSVFRRINAITFLPLLHCIKQQINCTISIADASHASSTTENTRSVLLDGSTSQLIHSIHSLKPHSI